MRCIGAHPILSLDKCVICSSAVEGGHVTTQVKAKYVQTIVIGGGQAGLSVGYHLAKHSIPFVILDASKRIGDAWRNRWDSLRLFTPARYAGLPGLAFPAAGDSYPTKQEMADYLQSYADRFGLPVRNGMKVQKLWRANQRFHIDAGEQSFEADQVIVAMATYQTPRVPAFARELNRGTVQLHSHEYRNPSQLQPGEVLVVGAGNSGADIAMEIAKTHRTWMSGRESGVIPFVIDRAFWRHVMSRVFRFIGHHVLTLSTPIGRKASKTMPKTAPLIRVKPQDLLRAGVERISRVAGVRDGKPYLADGSVLGEVKNVIWCTGYHPGFSWIDLPVFGEKGEPLHDRGIVSRMPGLYFVGLHFLYSMTSATVIGVGRDAERIAKAIESRMVFRQQAA
jgi:putative flavoprotein involved in K+ transport